MSETGSSSWVPYAVLGGLLVVLGGVGHVTSKRAGKRMRARMLDTFGPQLKGLKKGQLLNVEQMHAAHPGTFEIPSAAERKGLKVGDAAKVVAKGERFWVRIIKANDGRYVGVVEQADMDNEGAHGFAHKQKVKFSAKHVASIE